MVLREEVMESLHKFLTADETDKDRRSRTRFSGLSERAKTVLFLVFGTHVNSAAVGANDTYKMALNLRSSQHLSRSTCPPRRYCLFFSVRLETCIPPGPHPETTPQPTVQKYSIYRDIAFPNFPLNADGSVGNDRCTRRQT